MWNVPGEDVLVNSGLPLTKTLSLLSAVASSEMTVATSFTDRTFSVRFGVKTI